LEVLNAALTHLYTHRECVQPQTLYTLLFMVNAHCLTVEDIPLISKLQLTDLAVPYAGSWFEFFRLIRGSSTHAYFSYEYWTSDFNVRFLPQAPESFLLPITTQLDSSINCINRILRWICTQWMLTKLKHYIYHWQRIVHIKRAVILRLWGSLVISG